MTRVRCDRPDQGSWCQEPAQVLNRDCYCRTVNHDALQRWLTDDAPDGDLYAEILQSRPHLFSDTSVFVTSAQVMQMQAVIDAIEAAIRLPCYRDTVFAQAPAIARRDPGAAGVCMGYDFHLGPDGPQLIEINTNAGGAWLNAALHRAQEACCVQADHAGISPAADEAGLMAMFTEAWQQQRGETPLRTVAIVDEAPAAQYLAPEFRLAARMFRRHGLTAVIVDPSELHLAEKRLWYRETPIDLVYNRLTDFTLELPGHDALRKAYMRDLAVVTPHPHAHALYADKRNLTLLTDPAQLREWGLDERHAQSLADGIPRTVLVSADNADPLWATRRKQFFKPASGFGSRAAYRGDKLTRRVWQEMLDSCETRPYVAQQRIPPSERGVQVDGAATALKLDIRNYSWQGQTLLLAARLYQGQTTNFRTPGGGFASVFVA